MLSAVQSSVLVCFSVAAALLLVALLNRAWLMQNRKPINDVTGWQLGVLGVILASVRGR